MSTALDRAASDMKDILDDFGIEVPFGERIIIYKDLVVNVPFGTPKADCKRKLRKLTQLAAKERFKTTQGSLL